jgi:hypothetical protein
MHLNVAVIDWVGWRQICAVRGKGPWPELKPAASAGSHDILVTSLSGYQWVFFLLLDKVILITYWSALMTYLRASD